MKKNPVYKIGLGRAFLNRAGIIFILFILITLLLGGSAVYAEYKTGEIGKKVIQPVKEMLAGIAKSLKSEDKNTAESDIFISTSSATIRVNEDLDLENTIRTGNKTTTTIKTTVYPTAKPANYNTKSYEQSVQEMNEKAQKQYEEALKAQEAWSNQKQAENQAWFESASNQNKQQAQDWYNAEVQKAKEATEQWKKDHGF